MSATLVMEKAKHKAVRIQKIQNEAEAMRQRIAQLQEEIRATVQDAVWDSADMYNAWRDFKSFVEDEWENLDLRELGDVIKPIATKSVVISRDLQEMVDDCIADGLVIQDACDVQILSHYVTTILTLIEEWPTSDSTVRNASREAFLTSPEMTDDEIAAACCGAG